MLVFTRRSAIAPAGRTAAALLVAGTVVCVGAPARLSAQEREAPPSADAPRSPTPPPAGAPGLPAQSPPPAASEAPAEQDPAAPPTDATDAAEEAELAAELGRIQAAQSAASAADSATATSPSESSAAGASARGLSNLMNPAISANGLLVVGGTSRRGDAAARVRGELASGLTLQEVELVASAVVDPYFRADVTLAGSQDELGFEEAYLTTLELPRLTLRAGRMHAALGRHNVLHTHAFPFLTAPQPWRALLGPEGLVDTGVSADVLLPLPFFTEVNLQTFAGEWGPFAGAVPDDPTTPFDEGIADRRRDEDLAFLGHLKTLFDLSESSTLELGGTYVGGRNGFAGWTHVAAGDLTFKWRPIEAERYRGLDWTTEVLWVRRGHDPVAARGIGGAYTALRAQFAQRFWLQARGSVLGVPRPSAATPRTLRGEALIAFVPSEFSALRLQYGLEKTTGQRFVHELHLQVVFSIGPHPSHSY